MHPFSYRKPGTIPRNYEYIALQVRTSTGSLEPLLCVEENDHDQTLHLLPGIKYQVPDTTKYRVIRGLHCKSVVFFRRRYSWTAYIGFGFGFQCFRFSFFVFHKRMFMSDRRRSSRCTLLRSNVKP